MPKKKPRPQLLVVVSDLHCGSSVGLMPPDSEMIGGNTINFGKNLHQEMAGFAREVEKEAKKTKQGNLMIISVLSE